MMKLCKRLLCTYFYSQLSSELIFENIYLRSDEDSVTRTILCAATCCNTLQHTATHCNILQRTWCHERVGTFFLQVLFEITYTGLFCVVNTFLLNFCNAHGVIRELVGLFYKTFWTHHIQVSGVMYARLF